MATPSLRLLSLLLAAASLLAGPSRAAEASLDGQCRPSPKSLFPAEVVFRRVLEADGQRYWFSLARFQEGTGILCLSQPGYAQGRLLALPDLQNQPIPEITQEGQSPSFLVTVAYGNGLPRPMAQYRLDLTRPLQPRLTKLRQWVVPNRSVSSATPATPAAGPPLISHFSPTDPLGQLIDDLDLASFRNSLGPRREARLTTFRSFGFVISRPALDQLVLDDDGFVYGLRLLKRADSNRDGFEDLEVCFTEMAKHGTYRAAQAMLITKLAPQASALALKFEVEGCDRS